jgi:hypothetical protein
VTWIVGFHPHIEGRCGVVVTHHDMEIWIFGFYYYAAGCCDNAVMFPHVGTWIFVFFCHAEGYCDGAVTYFFTGLLPYAAVRFLPSRDLGVRLDACLRADRQVLAVWLIDNLVLLRVLLLVFLARCFPIRQLIRRMTQDSTPNFFVAVL